MQIFWENNALKITFKEQKRYEEMKEKHKVNLSQLPYHEIHNRPTLAPQAKNRIPSKQKSKVSKPMW